MVNIIKFVLSVCIVTVFSLMFIGKDDVKKAEAHVSHSPTGIADNYLGKRYVLGGLDCSGYTQRVYAKIGINLPDDPALQMRYGQRVSTPHAGDLVFFNEYGKGITHVGIYAGNGMIYHSSSYFGKVVKSKMRYIDGYVGARSFT